MDDNQVTEPLLYDPKVDRRPRRPSGCCSASCLFKCAGCMSISTILLVTGAVLWFASLTAQAAFDIAVRPHHKHHHNATAHNGTLPVISLLGRDEPFDVGVTVWLRATAAELGAHQRLAAERGEVALDSGGQEGEGDEWAWMEGSQALFSDVVFKGVKMSDRHTFETVHFDLPVERFCDVNLTSDDLRASFFILPHAGGMVDRAVNWTEVVPRALLRAPLRSKPFPLGSGVGRPTRLEDEIFEAASVSFPLVRWIIPPESPTPNATLSPSTSDPTSSTPADTMSAALTAAIPSQPDPARFQPFISTRTQLRLIDSVAEYSRTAFDARHEELFGKECNMTAHPRLAHRQCDLSWQKVGPFGVRVELAPAEGEDEGQVAYAPSLMVNPKSEGALDRIRVPVNRNPITQAEDGSYPSLEGEQLQACLGSRKSISIEWRLSFAGRTPAKTAFADAVSNLYPYRTAHNASDHQRAMDQDGHSLRSGLVGHPHNPKAHPRRRLFLSFAQYAIEAVLWVGSVHYWLTLQSTAGIARRTVLVSTAVDALSPILMWLAGMITDSGPIFALTYVIITLVNLPGSIQAYRVLRLELTWRVIHPRLPTVPWFTRRAATHWERHSDREELALPRAPFVALALMLSVGYALYSDEDSIPFIKSYVPPKDASDYTQGFTPRNEQVVRALMAPVLLLPQIVQFTMNRQRLRWAGDARWVAMGGAIKAILGTMALVPVIVGEWDHHPGLALDKVIDPLVAGALAWQAVRYRDAGEEESREREEEEGEEDVELDARR